MKWHCEQNRIPCSERLKSLGNVRYCLLNEVTSTYHVGHECVKPAVVSTFEQKQGMDTHLMWSCLVVAKGPSAKPLSLITLPATLVDMFLIPSMIRPWDLLTSSSCWAMIAALNFSCATSFVRAPIVLFSSPHDEDTSDDQHTCISSRCVDSHLTFLLCRRCNSKRLSRTVFLLAWPVICCV